MCIRHADCGCHGRDPTGHRDAVRARVGPRSSGRRSGSPARLSSTSSTTARFRPSSFFHDDDVLDLVDSRRHDVAAVGPPRTRTEPADLVAAIVAGDRAAERARAVVGELRSSAHPAKSPSVEVTARTSRSRRAGPEARIRPEPPVRRLSSVQSLQNAVVSNGSDVCRAARCEAFAVPPVEVRPGDHLDPLIVACRRCDPPGRRMLLSARRLRAAPRHLIGVHHKRTRCPAAPAGGGYGPCSDRPPTSTTGDADRRQRCAET